MTKNEVSIVRTFKAVENIKGEKLLVLLHVSLTDFLYYAVSIRVDRRCLPIRVVVLLLLLLCLFDIVWVQVH